MSKISAKYQPAPNRSEVGQNRRFSTNISLYLRNDARYLVVTKED